MRYQKIFKQIWHDEKFAQLSPLQQRLFLYLLTCPHGNLIGCYVLPEGYACADLNVHPEDLRKDFAKLLEMGLVRKCERTSVVLLPKFLKYNPLTNPNQKKAAARLLQELPKSPLLLHFKGLIDGLPEGFWKDLTNGLQEHPEETRNASEGASHTETETEYKYIYKYIPVSADKAEEEREPADPQPPPPPPASPEPRTRSRSTASRRKQATPLPPDFAISDRVRQWAKKHGHQHLEAHLEAFKLRAQAKDYRYVDWDAAFMTAIRENWAKLDPNTPPPSNTKPKRRPCPCGSGKWEDVCCAQSLDQ